MSGIMFRVQTNRLKLDQCGGVSGLLISFILVLLLLIGAAGFGIWAFMGRQDYKDNVDQKVAAAVKAAQDQQSATDAKTYAEAAKKPLKTYIGPAAYGSVKVMYPKTWSAYVQVASESGSSSPVDAYFQPDVVPDVTNQSNTFALRVEVVTDSYDQVVQQFSGQVQSNKVTVNPYALPLVPNVQGVKIDGAIQENKQGTMIVLPLRDKTLEIWTESQAEEADFNTYILPNISFSP